MIQVRAGGVTHFVYILIALIAFLVDFTLPLLHLEAENRQLPTIKDGHECLAYMCIPCKVHQSSAVFLPEI